jgi:hypothetical protein
VPARFLAVLILIVVIAIAVGLAARGFHHANIAGPAISWALATTFAPSIGNPAADSGVTERYSQPGDDCGRARTISSRGQACSWVQQ